MRMHTNIFTIQNSYLSQSKVVEGYSQFAFFQKRAIDVSFSALLLVATSPVMLYTIYRIRKESPGSILFRQSRVGLNGENFSCIKFRSMHENMEFNPYTEEKDPRIFPFGRLMRKMRIDELPQLWNVIRGDMHLIGPRAEWDILVNEYEKSIPKYQNRHLVRPGITGLAQVLYPYGRNINDARNKLRYDLKYIERWSIGLELKILWKTIMVVLGKKGV